MATRQDVHRTRLINQIRRELPGLADSEERMAQLLSVIGPYALLNMRNLGWGAVGQAVQFLAEHGLVNDDLNNALDRHRRQDQFKLRNGSWV